MNPFYEHPNRSSNFQQAHADRLENIPSVEEIIGTGGQPV